MLKSLLISIVAVTSLLATEVDDNAYSIQLATYSAKSKELAEDYLNKLPDDIRKDSVLYPQGKYLTIRYKSLNSVKMLYKPLKKARKIVRDAYIVNISKSVFSDLKNKNEKKLNLLDSKQIKQEEILILKKDKKLIDNNVNEQRLLAQQKLQNTFVNNSKYSYSLQLYSFHKTDENGIINAYSSLPEDIKKHTAIYPTGEYITLRYLNKPSKKDFNSIFKKVKFIFDDAYIATVTTDKFKEYLNQTKKRFENKEKIKNEDLRGYSKICVQKQSFEFQNLSTYEYTKVLVDAHEMKETNQIIESIKLYEKAFAHKQDNYSINNNLFYLYGKTNNWPKAVEKICLLRKKIDKVLYSYTLGALEINNPMLESELSLYLKDDKSGYLHLSLGVFQERNEDFEKAHGYYQKAYNLNRYDMYLAYAFARSSEIQSDYKGAMFIYGLIAKNNDRKYQQLQQQAYNRYNQLKRYLKNKG